MKTIKFSLDPKDISKAVKELERYKLETQKKCQLVVQKLTELGAQIARARVVDLGAVYSGHLMSSIESYYSISLNAGFIRVNADYGMFVEFGTGVKGATDSHPSGEYLAQANYQYMGGTTYVTTKDGRFGWYFPAEDGTWKFTEGQGSRPFMWETAQELEIRAGEVIKEVFGA